MPSRLTKSRPEFKLSSDSPRSSTDFPIHQDPDRDTGLLGAIRADSHSPRADSTPESTPSKQQRLGRFLHGRKASKPTLTPASPATVNSMPTSRPTGVKSKHMSSTPTPSPQPPARMASIRAVRSDDEPADEDSSAESTISQRASRASAFSSSVTSNASGTSAMSQQIPNGARTDENATVRLKTSGPEEATSNSLQVPNTSSPLSQRRSGETTRPSIDRSSFEIPQRESSRTAVTTLSTLANGRSTMPAPAPPNDPSPDGTEPPPPAAAGGWDSTIGKAGLGKTGRVINKLVSDNEALKRDIKIAHLRADEARQAARLLEDKMERATSDYESRLLEANVTKTLLARKERQVESLQAAVELERHRAAAALERERVWKEEVESVRREAKVRTEEASGYAALMEGRYNAIASHWSGQGEEVKRVVGRMEREVGEVREERRRDDEKISTLREVCDQQDGNIRELTRQKEEIAEKFEEYKREQEGALREIKSEASRRQEEQERVIAESKEVLHKLKWALKVKENVAWAE